MSELIVFSFENETGAHELESELVAARDAQQIEVGDAAMVVRAADGRAALNHAAKLVGRGSLGASSGVLCLPWYFGGDGGDCLSEEHSVIWAWMMTLSRRWVIRSVEVILGCSF